MPYDLLYGRFTARESWWKTMLLLIAGGSVFYFSRKKD
jgi:hypothetical protein